MIKKLLANTLARKISIFAVVFAVAVASMGSAMLGDPDVAVVNDSVDVLVMHAETESEEQVPADGAQPLSINEEARTWEPEEALYNDGPQPEGDPEVEEAGETTEPVFFSPAVEPTAIEGFYYLSELPLSEELQRYTYSKCNEQGIEYTLVLALMWRESGFQTNIIGHNKNGTSDSGIMQINDVNKEWLLRELAIDNLLDPYQNIDAGTEILSRFIEKYGQHNALLAYQYGESGMQRKLEQGVTTNSQIEKLYQKKDEFDLMVLSAGQ